MIKFPAMFQLLAVAMLVLSLGLAPVTDAVTHGPGTMAAEADHASWHAEKGELWLAGLHQHHDATDHDHGTSIILVAQENATFDVQTVIELHDLSRMTGAIRDGPRRPPRGADLAT